ncbi:MAG: sulfotransferase domain-containing protein [Bacteroidota bacterium]|nr:sulfotransferase domain-containing protein [Bacteroidota bacterium]
MIAHIGYHKTGTTFLQNNVYPYIKDVGFVDYPKCDKIFRDVIYKDNLDYNFEKSFALLSKNTSIGNQFLFSYEALVGPLFNNSGMNKKNIADRLKKLGFTKIIISIRNQTKLLESIYIQHIQEGGVARPSTFFDRGKMMFDWDYGNYFRLIKYYIELFGKDNVLVLLQEELKTDQEGSIKRIMDFIGSRVDQEKKQKEKRANKSLSLFSLGLLRIINHFTFNKYRPSHLFSTHISTWKFRFLLQSYLDPLLFSRISRKSSIAPIKILEQIKEFYKTSNTELSKLIGIDLAKYGYPM